MKIKVACFFLGHGVDLRITYSLTVRHADLIGHFSLHISALHLHVKRCELL